MSASAALLFFLPALSFSQINAPLVTGQMHLDGVLNEKQWESAQVISDFTQRELNEGAAPSFRTEVRVMHDGDNLWIGFVCHDPEPDKIIRKELKWDGGIANDDMVAFTLDTYHDKRMGYCFGTNANGAHYDATFAADRDMSTQWDGIWDVVSRVTPDGWACEMMIPFKTLRFPEGGTQEWGINFYRLIRRLNEEDYWRGWRRNEGSTHLASSGTVTFDGMVKGGKQFDVSPYVLGGAEKVLYKDMDEKFKYGLDVKYGVTSNTTLTLTAKTDFAQVESDREVINLTRFDLYYPEKREFFLEGMETFDFTQGGTRLFYSRRIGIDKKTRREIPILGGAKLTQKVGGYRLGVMTMQTEEEGGVPSTNYSVVRVRKDVFEQSYIGFIGTNVMDGEHHDNQVIGADFGYKTDKFLGYKRNFEIQGYLTGSSTDGVKHDMLAGRVYFYYPNDLVNWYGLYHAIDENFNPEVGFVSRVGIKNYIWQLLLTPRPGIPHVRKLAFKPFDINYTTDMDGQLLSRTVEIRPLGFMFNSGDELHFKIWNKYDRIRLRETNNAKGYNIFGNTFIPLGPYSYWYGEVNYTGSSKRKVYAYANSNWGDFYDGSRTYYNGGVTWKAGSRYAISGDITYNDIDVEGDRFITREVGSRFSVDFSTRLSSSVFVQYNNQSREVLTNFRLHFIPRIGSDLYIVYNHLMDEAYDYRAKRTTGVVKLNYTYRL